MADAATWAARVAEWRASGLSSPAYCRGKGFTAGGLRYMAHKLERGGAAPGRTPRVRIARVVRLSRSEQQTRAADLAAPALVVEIGPARIIVPSGVDRATLATVIALLAPEVVR